MSSRDREPRFLGAAAICAAVSFGMAAMTTADGAPGLARVATGLASVIFAAGFLLMVYTWWHLRRSR